MKTGIVLIVSVEVPDGYHMDLSSEPIEGGGYLYACHLRRGGQEVINFDLSDITQECQRAITDRIQSAVAKAHD